MAATAQESDGNRSSPDNRLLLLALVLVWLLLCVPVMMVSSPPLLDLPNHLARIYLAAAGADDPVLSRFYRIDWALIPNLAMDAAITPLARLLGVYDAARIFLALAFLIWLVAAMVLHRALHGRFSWLPLAAALFLYNGNVNLGFLSYFFSAGVAVLAFACWVYWRDRPVGLRFVFLLIAAPFLFLGHALALGLLILLVAAYEFGRQRRTRAVVTPGGLLVWLVPLLLPLLWFSALDPRHGGLDFQYGGLRDKISALISPVHMLSEYGRAEILLFLAVIVVLFLAVRYRRIAFPPAMKVPLLVLLGASFAAPLVALGIHFVDLRLPFIFWLLLTASVDYRPTSVREGRRAAISLTAILTVHIAIITGDWSRMDDDYAELFQAGTAVPTGSRVLTVCDCANNRNWRLKLHVHTPELLVIERQVFAPMLFTGTHILKVRPPYDRISSPQALPPSFADLEKFLTDDRGGLRGEVPSVYRFLVRWYENFDIVIALFPNAKEKPPGRLEPLHEGSFFTIYRNPQATPMVAR